MVPFLDIAPYPPIKDTRTLREVIKDTVDTVSGVAQQVSDNVQSSGTGGKIALWGAIAAALVALGFLIFFVAQYRKRARLGHALS